MGVGTAAGAASVVLPTILLLGAYAAVILFVFCDCCVNTRPLFRSLSHKMLTLKRLFAQTRWSPRTRMQTRSKSYICPNDTLVGNSCGTLLRDTLVGHSCETLLRDTLAGHSCGTLLWDTPVGHSFGTLLRDTLVGHSCGTVCGERVVL